MSGFSDRYFVRIPLCALKNAHAKRYASRFFDSVKQIESCILQSWLPRECIGMRGKVRERKTLMVLAVSCRGVGIEGSCGMQNRLGIFVSPENAHWKKREFSPRLGGHHPHSIFSYFPCLTPMSGFCLIEQRTLLRGTNVGLIKFCNFACL